ncbi:MAG: ribosomal protection-like ABC-F family protein [Dehalococcoidia bacterium]
MLVVERVTKRYGDHLVLQDVSFTIGNGQKFGLIGPNGCGKSTLARIIAGEEKADSGGVGGSFAFPGIHYLAQGQLEAVDRTAAASAPAIGELWRLGRALSTSSFRTADETVDALARFDDLGGWSAYERVEEILRGMQIDHLDPEAQYEQLSGGERTKLALAGLLHHPGPFLLLDEPSNHLDLDALAWLEQFLSALPGALLLVSHDRALIDAVVEAVIELDPITHRARRFAGGYSAYQAELARERESQEEAYQRQREQIERVEEDIRRTKQHAMRFDTTSQNDHWRRIGKKIARTAKVRERRLERLLESEERIEKPKQAWQLKAEITEASRSGDRVVEAEHLRLSFGNRTLFEDLSIDLRYGERVVLTGPNGCGKTTLLRVILGQLQPDSGNVRIGRGVIPAYLSQQQESIDLARTPLEEIRAAAPLDETEARTYVHRFLFAGNEVFTQNRALSFGQRSRLALAVIILQGVNLLVLDEPLNHLDIPSRERFEEALANFHGTILAVSHDHYFINRIASRVLLLEGGKLTDVDRELSGQ